MSTQRIQRLTIVALIIAVIGSATAVTRPTMASAPPPTMYLDSDEIATIQAAVRDQREPWYSAYQALMEDANNALDMRPRSVRDNGAGQVSGVDVFATDAPYTTDGKFNENSNRDDYLAAIAMGDAARDLGLAYAFTGDDRYARKARDLILHWMDTMKPYAWNAGPHTAGFRGNGEIELFITIPKLFYAADLTWAAEVWTDEQRATVRAWTRAIGNDAARKNYTNNFQDWRNVFLAAAGALTDEQDLLDEAFDDFRARVRVPPLDDDGNENDNNVITSVGKMNQELDRANSLTYSLYALNALVQTAEIARHHDVDLYTYQADDGRGLKLALDYHAPFAIDQEGWPHRQDEQLDRFDNVALYEVAHSYYGDDIYMEVVERWDRPMFENRIMGQVTLTHGGRTTAGQPGNPTPPPATPTAAPEPPRDDAIAIPGSFEVEDYREGGAGVGYHDKTPGNSGGAYRDGDVDIRTCNDGSNCYSVGWWSYGEWLAYDLNVTDTGSYTFEIRAATGRDDVRLALDLDEEQLTTVALPNTGSASDFTDVISDPVTLNAGQYTLKIRVTSGHSFDLNTVTVTADNAATAFDSVAYLPITLR